jgi:hypothetical protein
LISQEAVAGFAFPVFESTRLIWLKVQAVRRPTGQLVGLEPSASSSDEPQRADTVAPLGMGNAHA